jgi:hypothetical protein
MPLNEDWVVGWAAVKVSCQKDRPLAADSSPIRASRLLLRQPTCAGRRACFVVCAAGDAGR